MSENVAIFGATSGIARALCHVMSQRGCRLLLAGRDQEQLMAFATDLHIRYQRDVLVETFDALAFADHAEFFARCVQRFNGNLTGVVVCYGYMTEQTKTQEDFAEARRTIDVNFTAVVSLLNLAAQYFEQRQAGYIAVISSVAGDRGRRSNYTYGAAKAGLSAYLQGLRHRLHQAGVSVLTVKPGFVDTAMTQGMLNPNSPIVASPEKVAGDIDRAIRKQKNVIYTPWFWRGIMTIICALPDRLFNRLSL